MTGKASFAFGLVLMAIFLLLPLAFVGAQNEPFFGPIVPCDGVGCGICDLVNLGQNIINFAVYFVVIVATIAFVFAGFLYITAGGDQGKVKSAHNIFLKVLIGLIIVLTAWLVVDTIMKSFFQGSELQQSGLGKPWQDILCPTGSSSGGGGSSSGGGSSTSSGGSSSGGLEVGGTPDDTTPTLSHDDAFQQLTAEGVEVTSTSGVGGVQEECSGSGCTSLNDIRQTTVDEVITLAGDCSCTVVVTGGTEGGVHETGDFSHEEGYKVDVDDTDEVTAFIQENYFFLGERSDGALLYTSPSGAQYALEDNHWDILVTGNE